MLDCFRRGSLFALCRRLILSLKVQSVAFALKLSPVLTSPGTLGVSILSELWKSNAVKAHCGDNCRPPRRVIVLHFPTRRYQISPPKGYFPGVAIFSVLDIRWSSGDLCLNQMGGSMLLQINLWCEESS